MGWEPFWSIGRAKINHVSWIDVVCINTALILRMHSKILNLRWSKWFLISVILNNFLTRIKMISLILQCSSLLLHILKRHDRILTCLVNLACSIGEISVFIDKVIFLLIIIPNARIFIINLELSSHTLKYFLRFILRELFIFYSIVETIIILTISKIHIVKIDYVF